MAQSECSKNETKRLRLIRTAFCPTLYGTFLTHTHTHTHGGLARGGLELQNEEETPSHTLALAVATATQPAPPKTADNVAHPTLRGDQDISPGSFPPIHSPSLSPLKRRNVLMLSV